MKLFSSVKKIVPTLTQKAPEQNHPSPEKTPYELIGGEKGVFALSNKFYDIMESDPQAEELLAIHPKPLDGIRVRFFEYLSGWMGGPPLFEQQYGHPRLRARHLPYPVTPKLRDQWLYCMRKALNETVSNPLLRTGLLNSFTQLAHHMVNREDTPITE